MIDHAETWATNIGCSKNVSCDDTSQDTFLEQPLEFTSFSSDDFFYLQHLFFQKLKT